MTKFLLFLAALALGGSLLSVPARAASFDCSQARAPDDLAVCASPKLSALDSEMGGLWFAYSRVPMLMGGNGDRNDAAQAFLVTRRKCGSNGDCLTRVYVTRIEALRSGIDKAMAQFSRLQNGN